MTLQEKLLSLFPHRQIAEATLKDEGIMAAVATLRDQTHRRIEQSMPGDQAMREDLYHFLQALTAVTQELGKMVDAHRLVEKQIYLKEHGPKRGINV